MISAARSYVSSPPSSVSGSEDDLLHAKSQSSSNMWSDLISRCRESVNVCFPFVSSISFLGVFGRSLFTQYCYSSVFSFSHLKGCTIIAQFIFAIASESSKKSRSVFNTVNNSAAWTSGMEYSLVFFFFFLCDNMIFCLSSNSWMKPVKQKLKPKIVPWKNRVVRRKTMLEGMIKFWVYIVFSSSFPSSLAYFSTIFSSLWDPNISFTSHGSCPFFFFQFYYLIHFRTFLSQLVVHGERLSSFWNLQRDSRRSIESQVCVSSSTSLPFSFLVFVCILLCFFSVVRDWIWNILGWIYVEFHISFFLMIFVEYVDTKYCPRAGEETEVRIWANSKRTYADASWK